MLLNFFTVSAKQHQKNRRILSFVSSIIACLMTLNETIISSLNHLLIFLKAYGLTFPLSMVSRVLIALMLLAAQSAGIPSNCTVAINTARGLMSNPITFSPNFLPSHSTVPEPQNGSNTVDVVGSVLMISFSIHACMGATITAGYLTRGA